MFKKSLIAAAVFSFCSMSAFAGHMGGGMGHMGGGMGHMNTGAEHINTGAEHVNMGAEHMAGTEAPRASASFNHDFTTKPSTVGFGSEANYAHETMRHDDRDSMKMSSERSTSTATSKGMHAPHEDHDGDDVKTTSSRSSSSTGTIAMSGSTQSGMTASNPSAMHGIRGPVTTAPVATQTSLTPPNPNATHGLRGGTVVNLPGGGITVQQTPTAQPTMTTPAPMTTPAVAQTGLTPPNPNATHGLRGGTVVNLPGGGITVQQTPTAQPTMTTPATTVTPTMQPGVQAQRSPVHIS
ncbi:hypothetical protein AB3X96_38690 [Paraburkholderia sp. BR13439]|uniref:hypothetical protein n=1 Tax=Paraburkholderia sp. BR13439 TaxID=3236996 RepID=UPI0034CDF843